MINLKEKIYAGLLGKAIGVRLGAPVEAINWTKERIYESFGEISGYIKDSKRFAADDDTNGPIFFARAIYDYGKPLTYDKITKTWLNYTREEQGMFWWGGINVSTEHTAFNNLKQGIKAPESGSKKLNGKVISEQVGGQIFVDSWGLLNLGNIKKAMEEAQIAASISYDGEALIGAKFISGCIAAAINFDRIENLILEVLDYLDQESLYVKTMRKVYDFYVRNPKDYNLAYEYVYKNYGYDKFEGACHIIPNACIVLIGLLYSQNDFNKAVEITTACGWDTDSNAGVVGTIMGVLKGLEGIDWKYRESINDIVIGSSFSPDLNIINLVEYTNFLWSIINDKKYIESNKINFEFKGCTNGLQIDNDFRLIRDNISKNSINEYNILIDNLYKNDEAKIYLQTHYLLKDFPDNRYDPIIMPHIYSGDSICFKLSVEYLFNSGLLINGYIELVNGQIIKCTDIKELINNEEVNIYFTIPNTGGIDIHKVGINLTTNSESKDGCGVLARLKIRQIEKRRNTKSIIKFENQENYFKNNITPFSNSKIKTKIVNKKLFIETGSQYGLSISGPYYSSKQNIITKIEDLEGEMISIAFKIKGLVDFYSIDLFKDRIDLVKNSYKNKFTIKTFEFKRPNKFNFMLDIEKTVVKFFIENKLVMEYFNLENTYGHFGFGGINSKFNINDVNIKYS